MSRSYQHHALRNKFKEAYWACVCYFSNKKDKRIANQKFRTKNKQLVKKLMKEDPYMKITIDKIEKKMNV